MSKRWEEVDEMKLRQMEAEMTEALHDVRTAATVYAERAWEREGKTAAVRPVGRSGWMAWGAAGLAAVLLTVGGVRVLHHGNPSAARGTSMSNAPVVQVQELSSVSDEALLEQIQSDLSSGVPAAMEPLQATDAKSVRETVKRSE